MAETEEPRSVEVNLNDPDFLRGSVRGGPVQTLAVPLPIGDGTKTAVVLFVSHSGGHGEHILTPDVARATGEQMISAADAADEVNRKRIETYGPDDLRRLGPPGNGA